MFGRKAIMLMLAMNVVLILLAEHSGKQISTFPLLSNPSRHGLDFHQPQSQITIDSLDLLPRGSQKCLLECCLRVLVTFNQHVPMILPPGETRGIHMISASFLFKTRGDLAEFTPQGC